MAQMIDPKIKASAENSALMYRDVCFVLRKSRQAAQRDVFPMAPN